MSASAYFLGACRSPSQSLPPVPTRAQVCSVNLTFQGLTVTTQQLGTLPWFETAFQCLTSAADRQAVIAHKKAAGDTHLILEFFTLQQSIYDESGQPYQDVISPSGEQNPQWFRGLVEEVIRGGLTPIVAYDGDDGSAGNANALRQLPILTALLQQAPDLTPYVLFARLWDGVFYGATPDEIADFGIQFRKLLPNGHLAIEHNSGHIPVGEGGEDYQPGGRMTTYDVVMSEFDYSNDVPPNDTIWQIAARLLGPAYKRPPDQPSWDDPNPPWYMAPGCPRGPYFTCAFEWEGAYYWVRSISTAAQEAQRRAYLRGCGYTCTG